jgi:zinc and cadmium transporter
MAPPVGTFTAILLSCLAGGALSVLLAAACGLTPLHRMARSLVSFAVGVLLAAALLDLLPAAAEQLEMRSLGLALLCGLLGFFLLEKLSLWRHEHRGPSTDPRAAIGLSLTLGDGCHNFVDGLLLAAAYTQDFQLGLAMTGAIVAHEIPQELGDFLVLLAAGYSRREALALNLLASAGSLLGGVVGFFLARELQPFVPYALVVAASSFLYIAMADLVPMLQCGRRPRDFALQLPLMLGGMGIVVGGM